MQPSALFLRKVPIRFRFGEIKVSVESSDSRFSELLAERYKDFQTDDDPEVLVKYKIATNEVLDMKRLYNARHQVPIVTPGVRVTEMLGPHFRTYFQDWNIRIDGPRATYPIDFALTYLWHRNNPDGLILHGAGIVDGCRSWIASGPSGCGKTTLSRLVGEHALCDEFVGIVRRASHLDLVGLPFWNGRPGNARLKGIYFLSHGPEHRKSALHPSRAWPALRRQIIWPQCDSAAAEKILDVAVEVAQSVPCFELQFTPAASIWNLVREVS